ncbi:MAG TPA: hypothetical protein VIU02_07905, partial [Burkholderiales bacterium]
MIEQESMHHHSTSAGLQQSQTARWRAAVQFGGNLRCIACRRDTYLQENKQLLMAGRRPRKASVTTLLQFDTGMRHGGARRQRCTRPRRAAIAAASVRLV